ncbi:hypothetical protein K431DRAFT_193912, partial [Polychaeton citri CBS 116435]
SALSLEVSPENVVLAHPCRATYALIFTAKVSIKKTIFDNHIRIDKIRVNTPDVKLILRTLDDSEATVKVGDKYDIPYQSLGSLLQKAHVIELKVVGVGLHI